jgi:hypothetical protein
LPRPIPQGICDNGRTVRRGEIERRVLAGLTHAVVSPEAVAVAVRACADETNRQNHERGALAEADRRSLGKIERSIRGITTAIEDGMYQPAMKARMDELAQQKAEIEGRLADAPADVPDVHPNVAELYRGKIARLAETLANPESNGEAREDIRSLVGEVVLTPGEKRGEIHAILRGELMAILDLAEGRRRSPRLEVITTALASPRNQLDLHRQSVGVPAGAPGMFGSLCHAQDRRQLAPHLDAQPAVVRDLRDGLHQAADQLPSRSGLALAYTSQDNAISVVVTVIAPPILVAMEAKGISCMRFAAVKIATSPVPPWPLWQAFTMAVSIGYNLRNRPMTNPDPISVKTVTTTVTMYVGVNAAISLSHGVKDTPIANSKG